MARIKNKRELVLRSQAHARHDHVRQGTYGSVSANGKATFEGCAIGCLATPHRQKDLRVLWHRLYAAGKNHFNGGFYEGSDDQLDRLKSEFGIEPELARCAEAIFEGLPWHGGAISFIPAFAAALPEGYNLTPRRIEKGWQAAGGLDVSEDFADPGSAVPIKTLRDNFLSWLEGLA